MNNPYISKGLALILLVGSLSFECTDKSKESSNMRYNTEQGDILDKDIEQKMDTCYYTIKEEDKGYWDIAEKILYNEKRWKQIQELNKKFKSEDLKVGQIILIPCK
jgi:nucleoid-associated protein YgaU